MVSNDKADDVSDLQREVAAWRSRFPQYAYSADSQSITTVTLGSNAHRELGEVVNYALAAYKKSLPITQIFTVNPTDANGWAARYIVDAIQHYKPLLY